MYSLVMGEHIVQYSMSDIGVACEERCENMYRKHVVQYFSFFLELYSLAVLEIYIIHINVHTYSLQLVCTFIVAFRD